MIMAVELRACVVLMLFFCKTYTAEVEKFFREDYSFMNETRTFYKLHVQPSSTEAANKTCTAEGATYYTLPNKTAQLLVRLPRQDRDPEKSAFICHKTLETLEWNQLCHTHDMGYEYDNVLQRCYKYHTTPLSWSEAHQICAAERSYLTVVETEIEVNIIAFQARDLARKPTHKNLKSIYFGVMKKGGKDWHSVKGTYSNDRLVSSWKVRNELESTQDLCSVYHIQEDIYEMVPCHEKHAFVCEYEIPVLRYVIDYK